METSGEAATLVAELIIRPGHRPDFTRCFANILSRMSPPLAERPTPFYWSGGEAVPPLVKWISSNSILEIAASVLRISKN